MKIYSEELNVTVVKPSMTEKIMDKMWSKAKMNTQKAEA